MKAFNDDPVAIIPDEVPPAVEYDAVEEAATTLDGPGGTDPTKPHGKLP
jgi:hypothetical protein